MKALIMMVIDFNNYETFKRGLLEKLPNVLELCYYKERIQSSSLCEKFSLEEFEMPCKVFCNDAEKLTSDVSNASVKKATQYADVVVWFSRRQSILSTNTASAMIRLGKPVIHIQI